MKDGGDHIRVLMADDHPVVRAGIAAILANEPDLESVGLASTGSEAVALFEALRPDVILMDLQMPRLDGVSAIRAIRAVDPAARVIALATYDDDEDIPRALSAGAWAYLIKDAMVQQLVAAVRAAAIHLDREG